MAFAALLAGIAIGGLAALWLLAGGLGLGELQYRQGWEDRKALGLEWGEGSGERGGSD
jgi:hypothetical protein